MKTSARQDTGTKQKTEWIVTPGLLTPVRQFVDLYEMTRGMAGKRSRPQPIMICGDSGVGKSLFVHIVEQLAGQKVHRVNCAAFSDEVLESELFGHKKGAYTGAVADRKGHLLESHEGILVLEEIGDLSKRAQAKLLTFIEDGRFYPVGSEKEEAADVWIIGTTNLKQEVFRKDFWFRFFQFFVPPLHARREDVLYYILKFFPEFRERLLPWEVMALVAHHWPGNVREVHRVCMRVGWEDRIRQQRPPRSQELSPPPEWQDDLLHNANLKGYSELDPLAGHFLLMAMKAFGVPVQRLEKTLGEHRLSLSFMNNRVPIFQTADAWKGWMPEDADNLRGRLQVEVLPSLKKIHEIQTGAFGFSDLVLNRGHFGPVSLLDIGRRPHASTDQPAEPLLPNLAEKTFGKQTVKKVQAFLAAQEESADTEPSLAHMAEDDVLRLYWTQVHKEVDGNQTAAGKVAGTSADTAKHRFEKYGIIPSKKNK